MIQTSSGESRGVALVALNATYFLKSYVCQCVFGHKELETIIKSFNHNPFFKILDPTLTRLSKFELRYKTTTPNSLSCPQEGDNEREQKGLVSTESACKRISMGCEIFIARCLWCVCVCVCVCVYVKCDVFPLGVVLRPS